MDKRRADRGALGDLSADQLSRLATLASVSLALNSSYELEEVLRSVLETVCAGFQVRRGLIALSDDVGLRQAAVVDRSGSAGAGGFGDLTRLQPILDRRVRAALDSQGRPGYALPLFSRGKPLGVLLLESARVTTPPFSEVDSETLGVIAEMIAGTVDRTRSYSALINRTLRLERALAQVEQASRQAAQASRETIFRLSVAAELRDEDTGAHVQRVSHYAEALAGDLGLADSFVADLRVAAQLHDIGKLGVPDSILLKPGRFTDAEFEQMKKHTLIGSRILSEPGSAVIQLAETIARCHHERWDGKGYPRGLAEESIPLAARIVALADVFDALTTARCYKSAFPVEKAFEMIGGEAGHHFDPHLTQHFLGLRPSLLEIRDRFQDPLPLVPDSSPSTVTPPFWQRYRSRIDERILLLETTLDSLEKGLLTPELKERALGAARRLVDALGTLGLEASSRHAQALEQGLAMPEPESAPELKQRLGRLRTALAEGTASAPRPPAAFRLRDTTLLAVDSDRVHLENLARDAGPWGVNLMACPDAQQAKEILLRQSVDAAVVDLGQGLDFLNWLAVNQPGLLVLVTATEAGFEERLEVARLVGGGFLRKPLSSGQVFDELSRRATVGRLGTQLRVLVVDDDPAILALTRSTLELEGMEVMTLSDPARLWDRLEEFAPDAIILDFEMPGVSGEDVCKVLRNDPVHAGLPILVLTAHNDLDTMSRALAAGADDFLTKPATPTELVNRLVSRARRSMALLSAPETDPLTGLANRRQARENAPRLLGLAARQRRPFVLGLLELDDPGESDETTYPSHAPDFAGLLIMADRGLTDALNGGGNRVRCSDG